MDDYIPMPTIDCPTCGMPFAGWQGKDGPCAFFVWRQGDKAPVDQPIADECRLPLEDLQRVRLPRAFAIYPHGCQCSAVWAAIGETDGDERWSVTRIVTSDEARAFADPFSNT